MRLRTLLIITTIALGFCKSNAQSPQYMIFDDSKASAFQLLTDILPTEHFRLITGQYSIAAYHSAFSYNDLIKDETSSLININGQEAFPKLKDYNALIIQSELKTLGFGIRIGHLGIGFQHSITAYNNLVYPKDLFGLLFVGNAQYIGKTVNIGPRLNSSLYNSFGFGIGLDINKLKIAGRLNLLTGVAGAQTEHSNISLYTNPEYYQLELNTDYSIGTSNLINLDSLETQNISSGLSNYSLSDMFTSNFGISADLAVHYAVNDNVSIGLGIKGFGFLRFTKNAVEYSSNKQINYNGVDISDFINEDSVGIQGLLDSLSDLLKFDKRNKEFDVKLYPDIQLFSNYKLNELVSLYGGVNFSPTPEVVYWSASVGASFNILKALSFGANYSYLPGANFNLGTHLRLRLLKFDLQAGTDNILAIISPENYNFTTGYAGLRWHF